MSDLKSHWNSRYDKTDPDALTWFQADAARSIALIEKYAATTPAPILDVGAGNSRLADGLVAAGWGDVSLLDLSTVALEQTRVRLGKKARMVQFITADLTDWQPPRRWAIWHDRAVFHFMVTPKAQAAYLAALDQGTRPGATVVMATFSPDGPEKCSGLPVQRYSGDTLGQRLGPNYRRLFSETRDHTTPTGGTQNFTLAVFQKTAAESAP